jgi:hypothetical protein
MKKGGGAGSRSQPDDICFDRSRSVSVGDPVGDGKGVAITSSVSIDVDPSSGRKVERGRDPVCERLATALAQWAAEADVPALRRALFEILTALD